MIQVPVLYEHPTDTTAFERYYAASQLPLFRKVKGIDKAQLTKFFPNPDGSPAAYYRMAELWLETPETMQGALGSAEGKATTDDLVNFATGGVKVLVGTLG